MTTTEDFEDFDSWLGRVQPPEKPPKRRKPRPIPTPKVKAVKPPVAVKKGGRPAGSKNKNPARKARKYKRRLVDPDVTRFQPLVAEALKAFGVQYEFAERMIKTAATISARREAYAAKENQE